MIRGKEVTFEEAVKILERGRNIAGDNRKETEAAAKKAWGKELMRHDKHMPLGQPHFHHKDHTPYQYYGHAFYPGATVQQQGNRGR